MQCEIYLQPGTKKDNALEHQFKCELRPTYNHSIIQGSLQGNKITVRWNLLSRVISLNSFLLFAAKIFGTNQYHRSHWQKVKAKYPYLERLTALFTKPPSSVLQAVGMTSETVPAASPIHSLKRFSGIVPGKAMEQPGIVRPAALWIVL